MGNGVIAVFDSGVGGASILFACKELFPEENFIYIADNLNSPYGKKSKSFILNRAEELLTMLTEKYHIKAFIIACNTASFIVKEKLRDKFTIPIFAVEPPLKTFLSGVNKDKNAILLGTRHTLNSKKVKGIINGHTNIKPIYLKELAKKIDNSLNNFKQVLPYLKISFKDEKDIKAIILGCTHYHFIKEELTGIFPGAKIYSCEEAVSKYIKKILEKEKLLCNKECSSTLEIILTKPDKKLYNFILRNFYKTY